MINRQMIRQHTRHSQAKQLNKHRLPNIRPQIITRQMPSSLSPTRTIRGTNRQIHQRQINNHQDNRSNNQKRINSTRTTRIMIKRRLRDHLNSRYPTSINRRHLNNQLITNRNTHNMTNTKINQINNRRNRISRLITRQTMTNHRIITQHTKRNNTIHPSHRRTPSNRITKYQHIKRKMTQNQSTAAKLNLRGNRRFRRHHSNTRPRPDKRTITNKRRLRTNRALNRVSRRRPSIQQDQQNSNRQQPTIRRTTQPRLMTIILHPITSRHRIINNRQYTNRHKQRRSLPIPITMQRRIRQRQQQGPKRRKKQNKQVSHAHIRHPIMNMTNRLMINNTAIRNRLRQFKQQKQLTPRINLRSRIKNRSNTLHPKLTHRIGHNQVTPNRISKHHLPMHTNTSNPVRGRPHQINRLSTLYLGRNQYPIAND